MSDYVYDAELEVSLQAHGLDEAHRILREATRRINEIEKVHGAYIGSVRARWRGPEGAESPVTVDD